MKLIPSQLSIILISIHLVFLVIYIYIYIEKKIFLHYIIYVISFLRNIQSGQSSGKLK